MNTYIIGHTKPDTDAVVATLSWQFLCQKVSSYQNISNPTPAISDPLNQETQYLFEKFNVPAPQLISAKDITPQDRVILVDHNEASQRLKDLNPNQIDSIIDHHKVNLNLQNPIYITFKPWGSTNTIIGHLLLNTHQVKLDKNLAALMLSAILSDTVGFKSSTTTSYDKKIAHALAEIADITDIDQLTLEIFKAKSDVSKLNPSQIVTNDYKVFEFAQKTFIDQLETVEQEKIIYEKKSQLLEAMAKIKADQKVDLLYVAITDILKVNTKLLILGQEEGSVAEKAFGGNVVDNILDIGPKLSRKKDIAPAIEAALKT